MHMAIAQEVDTFNLATYLLIFITPLILFYLTSSVTRLSPVDRRILAKHLLTPSPPGLRGRSQRLPPCPRGRGPRNRPLCTRDKKMLSESVTLCSMKITNSSGRLTYLSSYGPPSGLVVVLKPLFARSSRSCMPSVGLAASSALPSKPAAIRHWLTTSVSTAIPLLSAWTITPPVAWATTSACSRTSSSRARRSELEASAKGWQSRARAR